MTITVSKQKVSKLGAIGTPSQIRPQDEILQNIENSLVGKYHFKGSQITEAKDDETLGNYQGYRKLTDFQYIMVNPLLQESWISQEYEIQLDDNSWNNSYHIYSLQTNGTALPLSEHLKFYCKVDKTTATVTWDGETKQFYHPFVDELLGTLNSGNLLDVFNYYLAISNQNEKSDAYGAFVSDDVALYHELKQPYSLYNWEAAFHAPMQLVDRLHKSQQYEQALTMCQYVFNPLASGNKNDQDPEDRYWQFMPFKEIKAKHVLDQIFNSLSADQPDEEINEWRNRPFQPHVIARSRPSAYMKYVVMKYIEILIDYGDYYFRQKQNMLEAMPMAIQCYVMASHLMGPKGQNIPRRGKIQPQTYNSLLDKWDASSNAMTELELFFPNSNQVSWPIDVNNELVGQANVFGFASALYFCIPDNPKLRELRDTIDDRLFKIRHCQDIEGVFFQPPLFEPPIDPGMLVLAAAQGLSLSSVLNDLDAPMPNYRFYYLLQKAQELCSELKSLGNAFLSAKEKMDGEELSRLRSSHESGMHNLVMEVKKQQLEEVQKSLEALQQSRKGPVYRLQHYLSLIGEDLGKIPNINTDFSELPNQKVQPVDGSELKLNDDEKEELNKASEAADFTRWSGISETLAGIFHLIPNFGTDIKPFGVGAGFFWGGTFLGAAAQATAKGLQVKAGDLSYQSTNASRKGGFLRQLQDRVQQANVAGYEIKNIDKQILTQQIRVAIAQREIDNQQKQMDNAQEVDEFLRNKYTNQELYAWMEGQIRTLYYQVYTLAYDLAKKAEKAYRYERGLTTSNFVQFGYWDAAHDGLLAGERLYLGLKQLETAYQEKRGHDYEIPKPVSLRQINPLALIKLKETGTCDFEVPEILFDMDFPGHFMRRIKSVALTIPCVVGPYTSVNCTLRLLEHTFRTSPIAKDYLERLDGTEDRFSTVNVPITSIAVSTAQNDSGVFELNFKDERYIPFEGAGAISKWRLELPADFRQFDYETITDVILHLRYTSIEGGGKLKQAATRALKDHVASVEDLSREEGLFAIFDLKHDFPNEWYQVLRPVEDPAQRILVLNNLNERLPIFTKGTQKDKIKAIDVYLFTSPDLTSTPTLIRVKGATEEEFALFGVKPPYASKDNDIVMDTWQLKIPDTQTEIEKMWMVVRYILK